MLTSVWVLPAVFLLDFILGDPRWLPHPVRWMGRSIHTGMSLTRDICGSITTIGFFMNKQIYTFPPTGGDTWK